MKRLTRLVMCGLFVGSVGAMAATSAEGAPSQKHPKHHRPSASVVARIGPRSFGARDVHVIREYYAPRYRSLPPGLYKKWRRTGQLPPGWQKRFHPFPVVVERRLIVLPKGYQRGIIDGEAVILDRRTHELFDIVPLF